jgi:uncharacterized protein YciI
VNDFDFLAGEWTVANRRRRQFLSESEEWDEFPARAKCVRLFDGAANVDWYSFYTLGTAGLSLRLFDPSRHEWSIYWASSRDGVLQPPVSGGFVGGIGTFYGDDTWDGRQIRVRYTWSDITARTACWQQAFSCDEENTWETNWIMSFERLPEPVPPNDLTGPKPRRAPTLGDHTQGAPNPGTPDVAAKYFVVETARGTTWDNQKSRRDQTGWVAHAAFMDSLVDDGLVVIGGPIGEIEGDQALIVVKANNERDARACLANDPWIDGVLCIRSIRPWNIWLRRADESLG